MNSGVFPLFFGQDPEVWLSELEMLFEEFDLPMDKWVDKAVSCLRGSALFWAFNKASLIMERDWCKFSYNILWEFDPSTIPDEEKLIIAVPVCDSEIIRDNLHSIANENKIVVSHQLVDEGVCSDEIGKSVVVNMGETQMNFSDRSPNEAKSILRLTSPSGGFPLSKPVQKTFTSGELMIADTQGLDTFKSSQGMVMKKFRSFVRAAVVPSCTKVSAAHHARNLFDERPKRPIFNHVSNWWLTDGYRYQGVIMLYIMMVNSCVYMKGSIKSALQGEYSTNSEWTKVSANHKGIRIRFRLILLVLSDFREGVLHGPHYTGNSSYTGPIKQCSILDNMHRYVGYKQLVLQSQSENVLWKFSCYSIVVQFGRTTKVFYCTPELTEFWVYSGSTVILQQDIASHIFSHCFNKNPQCISVEEDGFVAARIYCLYKDRLVAILYISHFDPGISVIHRRYIFICICSTNNTILASAQKLCFDPGIVSETPIQLVCSRQFFARLSFFVHPGHQRHIPLRVENVWGSVQYPFPHFSVITCGTLWCLINYISEEGTSCCVVRVFNSMPTVSKKSDSQVHFIKHHLNIRIQVRASLTKREDKLGIYDDRTPLITNLWHISLSTIQTTRLSHINCYFCIGRTLHEHAIQYVSILSVCFPRSQQVMFSDLPTLPLGPKTVAAVVLQRCHDPGGVQVGVFSCPYQHLVSSHALTSSCSDIVHSPRSSNKENSVASVNTMPWISVISSQAMFILQAYFLSTDSLSLYCYDPGGAFIQRIQRSKICFFPEITVLVHIYPMHVSNSHSHIMLSWVFEVLVIGFNQEAPGVWLGNSASGSVNRDIIGRWKHSVGGLKYLFQHGCGQYSESIFAWKGSYDSECTVSFSWITTSHVSTAFIPPDQYKLHWVLSCLLATSTSWMELLICNCSSCLRLLQNAEMHIMNEKVGVMTTNVTIEKSVMQELQWQDLFCKLVIIIVASRSRGVSRGMNVVLPMRLTLYRWHWEPGRIQVGIADSTTGLHGRFTKLVFTVGGTIRIMVVGLISTVTTEKSHGVSVVLGAVEEYFSLKTLYFQLLLIVKLWHFNLMIIQSTRHIRLKYFCCINDKVAGPKQLCKCCTFGLSNTKKSDRQLVAEEIRIMNNLPVATGSHLIEGSHNFSFGISYIYCFDPGISFSPIFEMHMPWDRLMKIADSLDDVIRIIFCQSGNITDQDSVGFMVPWRSQAKVCTDSPGNCVSTRPSDVCTSYVEYRWKPIIQFANGISVVNSMPHTTGSNWVDNWVSVANIKEGGVCIELQPARVFWSSLHQNFCPKVPVFLDDGASHILFIHSLFFQSLVVVYVLLINTTRQNHTAQGLYGLESDSGKLRGIYYTSVQVKFHLPLGLLTMHNEFPRGVVEAVVSHPDCQFGSYQVFSLVVLQLIGLSVLLHVGGGTLLSFLWRIAWI